MIEERGRQEVPDTPYLSREDRQLLELGKAEHRETTATARRALSVAEKTNDVARNTLAEMHRQGQQLERADLGMQQVKEEVKEASAILSFMRRWCCFQCCCCYDPTADHDRTRHSRVAAARRDLAYQQDNVGLQYAAKQEAIGRKARQHDPAYGNNEPAARHELFAQAGAIRAARQGPPTTDIGFGLPAADRHEIQQETEQQDKLIQRIENAVESLHTLSTEMHGEMTEQQPRIDRLQDRTARAHDELGTMMREAQRL